MTKRVLLVTSLALVIAWATPSAADTILFDPNGATAGGPGVIQAVEFDWLPGNSLIQEHGATATILFQANLGHVVTTTSPGGDFTNCSAPGLSCITAVAALEVALTPVAPGVVTYTVIPNSGVVKVYADTTVGNNFTGQGFALNAGAIEILSGTLISGNGVFAFNGPAPVGFLDQFPSAQGAEPAGNQWPNTLTLGGQGAANVTARVDSFNSSYFTNLVAGASLAITNTSQIDPYNQTNPSGLFSSNAIIDGNVPGVPSVGPVNGLGPNIVAQSDANSTFTNPIPEPATLTLFGLGLAATAATRRRQKKAKS